ncbi:Cytokine receptor common subunit gamma [Varanus komodoensis]|uniref:Fibronectin type-III domain-containing protein n=1 Tax=Varanus komodoensis TaxID=61221 RepID=A0A8D2KSV1_VARKO|nr:cytokine receptor common subunit gamma [Varanus komodoensis]KAF7237438.1 Cytokine receptor common subunit gamma [Varanus komodoensis]
MADASSNAGMLLVLPLIFLGIPGGYAADSTQVQVECIVYNMDYLICDWGSKQRPAANHSLYYWYTNSNEPMKECKNYLQKDGVNVGCRISDINIYLDFNIRVNASQDDVIPTEPIQLLNHVKPNPPVNLTLRELDNHQLLLEWNSTYRYPRCLEHRVKFKSNKDPAWMVQGTTTTTFSMPSVDPNKTYTFFVSSKVSTQCGMTDLWSDLAGPLVWGKEGETPRSFWMESILAPVVSILVLLVLLVALIHTERVRLVLMPKIPNPSKKFEELFTAYQGNFSEWAGFSKDTMESFKPIYCESICHVNELVPGGNDALGKFGGTSVEALPKASTE